MGEKLAKCGGKWTSCFYYQLVVLKLHFWNHIFPLSHARVSFLLYDNCWSSAYKGKLNNHTVYLHSFIWVSRIVGVDILMKKDFRFKKDDFYAVKIMALCNSFHLLNQFSVTRFRFNNMRNHSTIVIIIFQIKFSLIYFIVSMIMG